MSGKFSRLIVLTICVCISIEQSSSETIPDPTSLRSSGAKGQNCGKFGIPVPATVCNDWCVIPSPIGSCDKGGKCCLVVKSEQELVSGGNTPDSAPDSVSAIGPWGGRGQNCGQFGIPIPATVCSDWCVIPSPIGNCDKGGKCCIIVKNEQELVSLGNTPGSAPDSDSSPDSDSAPLKNEDEE